LSRVKYFNDVFITRFAEFVVGSPHISQDEVMEYSRSDSFGGFEETDDENEDASAAAATTAAFEPQMMTDDEDSVAEDAVAAGDGSRH